MATSKNNFFESLNQIANDKTDRKEPGSQKDNEKKFYVPPGEKASGETAEENPEEKTSGNSSEEKINEGNPNLNFDPKKSGETSAILFAGCCETVMMLAERLMLVYGRFTDEEKEKYVLIQDKDESELNPREKEINRKFVRILEKHVKIREKIDFSENEMEALAEGFAEHARITGKPANPKLILYATGVKALVSRSMDIFF